MVINTKRKGCNMVYFTKYLSPLGELLLTVEEGCLTGLFLDTQSCPNVQMQQRDDLPVFDTIRDCLDRYFRGEAPSIEPLPLSPFGSAFQMQVWDILRRIPYGQTITYGDIAKELARLTGKETMSAQAVGQAVGRNPISILIPCHRVVGAGGKLTGYAGGLDKKIWLLRHEGWYKEEKT